MEPLETIASENSVRSSVHYSDVLLPFAAPFGAITALSGAYLGYTGASYYQLSDPMIFLSGVLGSLTACISGTIGYVMLPKISQRVCNRYSKEENSPLLDIAIFGGGLLGAMFLAQELYKG